MRRHAFVRVRTWRLLQVAVGVLGAAAIGEAVLLALIAKGGL